MVKTRVNDLVSGGPGCGQGHEDTLFLSRVPAIGEKIVPNGMNGSYRVEDVIHHSLTDGNSHGATVYIKMGMT